MALYRNIAGINDASEITEWVIPTADVVSYDPGLPIVADTSVPDTVEVTETGAITLNDLKDPSTVSPITPGVLATGSDTPAIGLPDTVPVTAEPGEVPEPTEKQINYLALVSATGLALIAAFGKRNTRTKVAYAAGLGVLYYSLQKL